VNAGRILWVAGAYFVGVSFTFPIVRLKASTIVAEAAKRSRSEADAHILIRDHIGMGWMVLAATIDVTKAGLYPLAARRFGDLPDGWVALCGFILVLGYAFPLFWREMAGRGLGAAAGVMLALVPIAMIIGGLVTALGVAARRTGPASTFGFALVPVAAALQGQPGVFVAMSAGLVGLILLRRLDGVGEAARQWGWPLALWRRLLFDADVPATPSPGALERGEQIPPA
jgi:glycerol-3-phosphate acyltransferase PlsY